jgi:hypothetical protein
MKMNKKHRKEINDIQDRLFAWIDKTREMGYVAPWPWDKNGNPIDEKEPKLKDK